MNGWMIAWTVLLAGSCTAFAGMLVLVGHGAVKELWQTLDDLRQDTREAAEHPEVLDEEI